MATLDAPPQRGEKIELAVQREMARRRRLLRLYLALLLIPVGAAVWFVAAGRTDRDFVQQAVKAGVAPVEQRYSEIAPKLDQVHELDQVLPAVRSAAHEVQAQKEQVSALAQTQDQLRLQLNDVTSNVRALVKITEAAPGPGLDSRIGELAKRVEVLQNGQEGLLQQQKRIAAEVEKLHLERQPPPGAGPDASKLEERLRQLELDNRALRGELRKMQAVRPPG